jgi:hypothetical protein
MNHVRDYRIDLLRGIALVMIFINHVPGTIWENFTSRNFGFSDAAEGFVLMSGMATGLAYGTAFLGRAPRLGQALRPWRRAVTLWSVHMLIILALLLAFAFSLDHPQVHAIAFDHKILPAIQDPVGFALPLALLGHQFAYADILPLYVVLMLAAPALLFLAARWPRRVMAGSLLLWLVVGLLQIRMPTFPTDYGWLFNPLSWQVLFVAGVLTGLGMRQGKRFLPYNVWAFRLAVAFLVASALWVQVPMIADRAGYGLWLLQKYGGLPELFTTFEKSFVCLPRLLHILALAYVLSAWPVVKTLAGDPRLSPIVMLGRHSLPVFAAGTILAYIGQVTKAILPASTALDTLLIVAGIAILFAVGAFYDRRKRVPLLNSRRPVPDDVASSKLAV